MHGGKKIATQIMQAIKNVWAVVGPIFGFIVSFIWESVKGLVSGVITFFQGIIEFFTGVFTGDFANGLGRYQRKFFSEQFRRFGISLI